MRMGRPRAYYCKIILMMTFDDGCGFHPVPNATLSCFQEVRYVVSTLHAFVAHEAILSKALTPE